MQAIFATWMATSSTHFVWLNNVFWERGEPSPTDRKRAMNLKRNASDASIEISHTHNRQR